MYIRIDIIIMHVLNLLVYNGVDILCKSCPGELYGIITQARGLRRRRAEPEGSDKPIRIEGPCFNYFKSICLRVALVPWKQAFNVTS